MAISLIKYMDHHPDNNPMCFTPFKTPLTRVYIPGYTPLNSKLGCQAPPNRNPVHTTG